MSKKSFYTKFGKATLKSNGYFMITSIKEGNHGKRLHRLIYEDYHKCTLLPKTYSSYWWKYRTNNDISNLQLMCWGDHTRLHHKNKIISEEQKQKASIANKGRKPFLGRKHSEESKKKMSEVQKGRIITNQHKLKLSKSVNTTGYFRVSKQYSSQYSKGFRYRYIYTVNGKRMEIKSVDLEKLKKKVLDKGLPWIEL